MFDNVQVYTWAYLGWETEAYCIILSGPVHVLPWCRCQRKELHTCSILKYFTQSVSEGLSSHLIISYHLIFSSSYLLTSSHLQIFSPSHLLIFNHLLIFTSSHIFSSPSHHLLIFFTSSSHLPHILSSSHLDIFSSSHLHIFLTSSSHLLIFIFIHFQLTTYPLCAPYILYCSLMFSL